MRKNARLAHAIILALLAAHGCKDETPPNEPGEFGEACLLGEPDDSPNGCHTGLYCYLGYCIEDCITIDDCQPIEGWERECSAGLCHISCNTSSACPEDLGTPLTCDVVTNRCKAEATD